MLSNTETLHGYLSWHYDDKPINGRECFIDIGGNLQIAMWRADVQEWDNVVFGWVNEAVLPMGLTVRKWAYVPNLIINYLHPECGAYLKRDDGTFCLGTKEIDPCDCGGNRSCCSFY